MNKKLAAAAIAGVAVGVVLLSGCAAKSDKAVDKSKVWGYVASAKGAQIEVAENQDGADRLVVKRVKAPGAAWLVVHADNNGTPGMRVGLKHIDKGESTDVAVDLKDLTTPSVIVAVHADKGKAGKFDFDMMNKEMSPDRPYFVDEKELAAVVKVREFGIPAESGTAAIEVADQVGASGALKVTKAAAPTAAWVVVHLDDKGAPGGRVGLLHIPAGESVNLSVPLEPLVLTDKLFVAVHADALTPNIFDFDMMNKINSADQPFFVDGKEVATVVTVK